MATGTCKVTKSSYAQFLRIGSEWMQRNPRGARAAMPAEVSNVFELSADGTGYLTSSVYIEIGVVEEGLVYSKATVIPDGLDVERNRVDNA
jgi:hypothetical protein